MGDEFNEQQEIVIKEAEKLLALGAKLGTNTESFKEIRTLLNDMLTDVLYMMRLVDRKEREIIKLEKKLLEEA